MAVTPKVVKSFSTNHFGLCVWQVGESEVSGLLNLFSIRHLGLTGFGNVETFGDEI